MTLTPEQFNLIAMKADLEPLARKEDVATKKDIDNVLSVLDTIVSKLDNIEKENVSNISAHARINRDLIRIKDHSEINSMEVVEQI